MCILCVCECERRGRNESKSEKTELYIYAVDNKTTNRTFKHRTKRKQLLQLIMNESVRHQNEEGAVDDKTANLVDELNRKTKNIYHMQIQNKMNN